MGRQQRESSTRWMLEALARRPDGTREEILPAEFLCGLRGALEAGLSCEQITAALILVTGVYKAGEKMTGSELVQRAVHLSNLMEGDICYCAKNLERSRKSQERKTLFKKRKKT